MEESKSLIHFTESWYEQGDFSTAQPLLETWKMRVKKLNKERLEWPTLPHSVMCSELG